MTRQSRQILSTGSAIRIVSPLHRGETVDAQHGPGGTGWAEPRAAA